MSMRDEGEYLRKSNFDTIKWFRIRLHFPLDDELENHIFLQILNRFNYFGNVK